MIRLPKWEQLYQLNYELSDWEEIFCIPKKLTKNKKIWLKQYMLLHRLTNHKENLMVWGKSNDANCTACGIVPENLEHMILTCPSDNNLI